MLLCDHIAFLWVCDGLQTPPLPWNQQIRQQLAVAAASRGTRHTVGTYKQPTPVSRGDSEPVSSGRGSYSDRWRVRLLVQCPPAQVSCVTSHSPDSTPG